MTNTPCEHCNSNSLDPWITPTGRAGTIHVTDEMVDGYADEWLCPACAHEYRAWIREEWLELDRRAHADHFAGCEVTPLNALAMSDADGRL